jgi:hypothetical protein
MPLGSGHAKWFLERSGSEVAAGFEYMKFVLVPATLLKFEFASM